MPVRLDSLGFTPLEARLFRFEEDLRMNRLLARDIDPAVVPPILDGQAICT